MGLMRSRSAGLIIAGVAIAFAYRWSGIASLAVGLLVFMLYESLVPPRRHRRLGPGQIQEAVDNDFGHFGRSYREDEPDVRMSRVVGRNKPCVCGSGLKFKRCCGRVPE